MRSALQCAFVGQDSRWVRREHGKGVATCRTEHGWSAPAPISITGGSWGLQLGGQAIDLVMVFMGDQGMAHLLSDHFKIGGDASAAAGPVGRDAAAGTDVEMNDKILTYSRARGLFAGIDFSGSVSSRTRMKPGFYLMARWCRSKISCMAELLRHQRANHCCRC